MRFLATFCLAGLSTLALAGCGGGAQGSRDFVRVVGSSTLYPFATAVSEQVARAGGKAPVVESTGTGAGMKLFCAGVGVGHPDIENASRRMKASEYADCQKNGVTEVIEIQVGIDGIALAEAKAGPGLRLTPEEIYRAVAANPYGKPNTAKQWRDINPALPAMPILIYGPPTTSGTRDAFEELIMAIGCDGDPAMKALKDSDKDRHEQICTAVREDGAYVDAGENDNLIVQKVSQNPRAIGIFGFSFLEENGDKLKGVPISGVDPTYETISDFTYPGARPIYIYVKKAHMNAIKGIGDYVAEWARAWGPDGYLKTRGMVVSPEDVRARNAEIAANLTPLDPAQLN